VEQLKHALHQSERPLRVATDSQLFRAAIQKRGSIHIDMDRNFVCFWRRQTIAIDLPLSVLIS
jgi:hypothetical protein